MSYKILLRLRDFCFDTPHQERMIKTCRGYSRSCGRNKWREVRSLCVSKRTQNVREVIRNRSPQCNLNSVNCLDHQQSQMGIKLVEFNYVCERRTGDVSVSARHFERKKIGAQTKVSLTFEPVQGPPAIWYRETSGHQKSQLLLVCKSGLSVMHAKKYPPISAFTCLHR